MAACRARAEEHGPQTEKESPDEGSDVSDIAFLIRHLQLKSAPDVLEVVGHYYPANRIPPKTRYLVEGLFEEGRA